MPRIADHFEQLDALKSKPKWVLGDRVYCKLGKIPVMGMVIREDYTDSSLVLIHSDLPVKTTDGVIRWVFFVPSKSIKRLKVTE